jgi:hypothetical protein
MPRFRWAPFVLGAATFLAAHAIEVAVRIGGPQPWFISAPVSALFTAASMFVIGVGFSLNAGGHFVDLFVAGVLLAVGASIPALITLLTHPAGPGNLFPLALMVAVGVLLCSSVAGVSVGWLLRRVMR